MVTLKARMTNYGLPRYRWLTHAWNFFQREVSAAIPGGWKQVVKAGVQSVHFDHFCSENRSLDVRRHWRSFSLQAATHFLLPFHLSHGHSPSLLWSTRVSSEAVLLNYGEVSFS